MKFIAESYSSYAKGIHQIWLGSAKFLWKSKFCSNSGSGSGSWYHFGFQYQTYISCIEDTHQILFGSTNSFESYCVHMKSPRTYSQTTGQTDRQTEIFLCLFCCLRHTKHEHSSKGDIFFHSCDYNNFSSYILRMWWEDKKHVNRDFHITFSPISQNFFFEEVCFLIMATLNF